MAEKWIKIGSVGVDSGMLMVCDPSYVDGEWVADTEAPGHHELVLTEKGKTRFPGLHKFRMKCFRDFGSYSEIIPDLGMSMNDAREEGLVEEVERGPTGEFSYNGCCLGAERGHGQLKYKRGHDGVGVVFSSGYGDGFYPVYARIENDRIAEIRVVMMGDEFPRITKDGRIEMPKRGK